MFHTFISFIVILSRKYIYSNTPQLEQIKVDNIAINDDGNGGKERNKEIDRITSKEDSIVEYDETISKTVNVQFTLEEAQFVVNMLDQKVEELARIEQRLKGPISQVENRNISGKCCQQKNFHS